MMKTFTHIALAFYILLSSAWADTFVHRTTGKTVEFHPGVPAGGDHVLTPGFQLTCQFETNTPVRTGNQNACHDDFSPGNR